MPVSHKFDAARMARLESEERRRTLDPERALEALELCVGETFLDLGAGPGFFSLPAAAVVGPAGRVLAVDVSPQMVERVRQRAEENGLGHVEAILSHESQVPLSDEAADALLLSNVLHEAAEPRRLLAEAHRLLKPGGRLAVIEWKKERTEHGPALEDRLESTTVDRWLIAAGFARLSRFEPGPYHFGVIAVKV